MGLGGERVVGDAPSATMASETIVNPATMATETVVAPASGGTVAPDMGLGGERVVADAPSATMASETVVDPDNMATETVVAHASGGTLAPDIGLGGERVDGDAPSATMASETVVDPATMATETVVAPASGGTLAPNMGLGSEAEMRDSSVNADGNVVDVNKGSEVAAYADLGKAPVTCVYKSTRRKKKLRSLADKDREIKSLVCNELGITPDMAPFGLLDNESNPKKATPKRKNIPKSRAHLPKKQAIRSSPRLAKHHSSASVSIPRATTSPIDLDMSSPEVSPARVEVAAVIEAGPLDAHATSARGGALSSPPYDTGAVTLPELATEADATTGAEAANETLAATESNEPRVDKEGNIFISATTLFKNVVPDVISDVLFQEDHVEKADVVEDDGPTYDTPYQGSPGVFVPTTSLFPDIDPPMWNFTSQSPVSKPAVAPSPDVPSNVGGANNPSQPLSNATATLVLSVSSDALDDIPEGIPLGAPVGVTSSSNEDAPIGCANPSSTGRAPGDLFHEFEPEGLVPLSCSFPTAPAITTLGHNPVSLGITPRTRLRTVRVIQPAKALLSPFSYIVTTKSQDSLYEKVIVHNYDEKKSRIKGSRILHIEPMWVNTWELVDCVKPGGELSNNICDIAISVLQESCPEKKVIFPYIVTKYLMEHKFNSKIVQNYFRKDEKYKLSFPVLQTLGVPRKGKKPIGHWYVLSLNMGSKRFEILDSLRGEDDMDMIEHANKLVEAIKMMYKINYSNSYRQIDDFELMYIPVPKQKNGTDCGFFMLKFLELWNGSVVPAISQDQIPALRKVLTSLWLEHDRNELINWRSLLDNNMI
ncbi:hypothetical protein ACQ4PT_032705 [Festuca glaucescens]